MAQQKEFSIQAILTIFSPELSETIRSKIEENGKFTTVTDNVSSDLLPMAFALLSLDIPYQDENEIIQITHACIVKKGQRVATGQIRLQITDVIELPNISYKALLDELPKRFQGIGKKAFSIGYKKVAPKTGQHLFKALLKLCPGKEREIHKLISKLDQDKIIPRTARNEDAAVEKDAFGLALDIFGADRKDVLRRWDAQDASLGQSFLSGLKEYSAYEDDIISHDLHTLPGWNSVSEVITGVVEFENSKGEKLTVINANRKPAEKATGTDLIYFHRDYEAFTFVQYKMMDKHGKEGSDYYYNPNQKSHTSEFARLKNLQQLIDKEPASDKLLDYRLAQTPIFFKVCKKIAIKS
ncbi:MAG: hypothetical protein GW903_00135 [Alphaproteobacteria bacterium]|nr:hypothetical protein [Alphaproteobacteria bacterium]NCQ87378.1 hypothetical protein [Alphaproteobacteria bacterium]NCT06249.1 hypothetical protein [Alphaproteobacteria bacterium]